MGIKVHKKRGKKKHRLNQKKKRANIGKVLLLYCTNHFPLGKLEGTNVCNPFSATLSTIESDIVNILKN